jgi:hypothetical protein
MSLEEVAVRASHEVLLEVDDNSELIVDDPQVIQCQQLRPHSIHFLKMILILLTY